MDAFAVGHAAPAASVVQVPPPAALPPLPAPGRAPPRLRTRLWELNGSVHCSVIGTCLTTGELRALMAKVLGRAGVDHASDHDLHAQAVGLCGGPGTCAKLLGKALDKRHAGAIHRFARVAGEDAVMALWAEFRRAGDIPGAYWAVLTHPDVGHAGLRRAFGDVHMLSHMVGAANRADIRRLTALEEENAALRHKAERQQERLRQLAVVGTRPAPAPALDRRPDPAFAALVRQLDEARTRLAAETARRERAEERLCAARAGQGAAEDRAVAAETEAALLRRELAVLRPEEDGSPGPGRLPPECVLYVGGRPGTVEQARFLLEEAGGELLLHDGGQHDNASLLPGLVNRADRVVFPVDCVSHDAALAVKRLCRLRGKPWVPLRSASLAAFLACMAPAVPGTAADPRP